MGLFSKKQANSSRRATQRPRPSVSSEAQAATLRVRARRRLAGAVALVLAAVIVLPMLLDGEPRPVPAGIEIVVPERNAPFNPDLSRPPADASDVAGAPATATQQDGVAVADASVDQTTASQGSSVAQPAQADAGATPGAPRASDDTAPVPAAPAAAADSNNSIEPETKPDNTAVAMAILEGRKPAASGNHVLQIASYAAQSDAQSRVDKLKSQGVSNAFVQTATVNGKPTYRLRVGPFDSKAAAQAAQARLRTLGYDNGFITTK